MNKDRALHFTKGVGATALGGIALGLTFATGLVATLDAADTTEWDDIILEANAPTRVALKTIKAVTFLPSVFCGFVIFGTFILGVPLLFGAACSWTMEKSAALAVSSNNHASTHFKNAFPPDVAAPTNIEKLHKPNAKLDPVSDFQLVRVVKPAPVIREINLAAFAVAEPATVAASRQMTIYEMKDQLERNRFTAYRSGVEKKILDG